VPEFYNAEYAPRTASGALLSLEDFLRGLGDCSAAYHWQFTNPNTPLWAKEHGGDEGKMHHLLMSAKLFVQDKIACGMRTAPEHIFALHLYTMQSSIYVRSCAAMLDLCWPGIRLWRPFIYYVQRALAVQTATQTTVYRGLHLRDETGGTVAGFLDGLYPKPSATLSQEQQDNRMLREGNARYHPGGVILWPAFSSTSENPAIALAYATKDLEEGKQAAVILKIVTKNVCPIKQFSYYEFEEELLYQANTAFKVKALLEPTAYNMRRGASASQGDFFLSTEYIQTKELQLEEAKELPTVLIELHEEALPASAFVLKDPSE